jgi:hypothetical protein
MEHSALRSILPHMAIRRPRGASPSQAVAWGSASRHPVVGKTADPVIPRAVNCGERNSIPHGVVKSQFRLSLRPHLQGNLIYLWQPLVSSKPVKESDSSTDIPPGLLIQPARASMIGGAIPVTLYFRIWRESIICARCPKGQSGRNGGQKKRTDGYCKFRDFFDSSKKNATTKNEKERERKKKNPEIQQF